MKRVNCKIQNKRNLKMLAKNLIIRNLIPTKMLITVDPLSEL